MAWKWRQREAPASLRPTFLWGLSVVPVEVFLQAVNCPFGQLVPPVSHVKALAPFESRQEWQRERKQVGLVASSAPGGWEMAGPLKVGASKNHWKRQRCSEKQR